MLCEKEVQQLWSPGLEKFLADRFVEGTCPLVSHPDGHFVGIPHGAPWSILKSENLFLAWLWL